MAPYETSPPDPAPSSRINCGLPECGLAKVEPAADWGMALQEYSLAHAQQAADEDGLPAGIGSLKHLMLGMGCPSERIFAAVTCGHLAAGTTAVCRYRNQTPMPPAHA